MEAASVSRRLRLEELKRRKTAALENGANAGARVNEEDGIVTFDEDDRAIHYIKSAEDEEALKARIRAWSLTKLVRSFRVLDKKERFDFTKMKDTIERQIAGMQELVIAEHERKRDEELDLHNIAPKRINWDLKRDMNKRLAKLERRDREARLILIRQRIQTSSKTDSDAGQGVQAAAAEALSTGLIVGHESDSDSEDDGEAGA
jgi:coiled-coil domain-containing protein 12